MSIKKNLLGIVKVILSDMDSEDVDSIDDSEEAQQVARIVEKTYYSIIATRVVPEHAELLKLDALSDTNYPTHFRYPDYVTRISAVWYKDSDDFYRPIKWMSNEDFLYKTDTIQSNYTTVSDKNGGTTLRVGTDANPTFYTSFDDDYLVFNSYDNTVDDTLQESKVRAMGYKYPTFTISDTFVPDLDGVYFPYLIAEATSLAASLLKGAPDQKIEQMARRQKSYIQNDKYNSVRPASWKAYGR